MASAESIAEADELASFIRFAPFKSAQKKRDERKSEERSEGGKRVAKTVTCLLSIILLTAFFLGFSVCYSVVQNVNADLGSKLVGYWKFDEGNGTTAYDSSGYNNHGTLVNGPTWVDGISGRALHFDGVDDYVNVSDSDTLDITDDLIIDLWFKPDINITSPYDDKGYFLISKWHGIGDESRTGYLLFLNLDPHPGDGKLRFFLGLGNWEMNILASNRSSWYAGEWYHIKATYDKDLPSGNMKLYINETLDSELKENRSIAPSNISLHFNMDPYELWHQNNTYFATVIDEVKISGTSASVGGIVVPVDKFGLLVPYISVASTCLVATVAVTIYIKRVNRRKEKQ